MSPIKTEKHTLTATYLRHLPKRSVILMYYLEKDNTPVIPKVALSTSIPALNDFQEVSLVVHNSERQGKTQPFEDLFQSKPFDIADLSIKFANLKTPEDIVDFANSYGLLGVKYTLPEVLKYDWFYLSKFEYDKSPIMEPLAVWHWHIGHVKKLIKLYKALKDGRDLDRLIYVDKEKEENLLPPPEVREFLRSQESPDAVRAERAEVLTAIRAQMNSGQVPKIEKTAAPEYRYYWNDHRPTLIPYKEPKGNRSEEDEMKFAATMILRQHLQRFLENGIFIDFSVVKKDDESPLGFSFEDRKATNYLLAAIYFDLFRMVNNIRPVAVCDQCTDPFVPKRKDAKFCGKTCQKRHERAEKQKSLGA